MTNEIKVNPERPSDDKFKAKSALNPKHTDNERNTAFIYACEEGYTKIVELLSQSSRNKAWFDEIEHQGMQCHRQDDIGGKDHCQEHTHLRLELQVRQHKPTQYRQYHGQACKENRLAGGPNGSQNDLLPNRFICREICAISIGAKGFKLLLAPIVDVDSKVDTNADSYGRDWKCVD